MHSAPLIAGSAYILKDEMCLTLISYYPANNFVVGNCFSVNERCGASDAGKGDVVHLVGGLYLIFAVLNLFSQTMYHRL